MSTLPCAPFTAVCTLEKRQNSWGGIPRTHRHGVAIGSMLCPKFPVTPRIVLDASDELVACPYRMTPVIVEGVAVKLLIEGSTMLCFTNDLPNTSSDDFSAYGRSETQENNGATNGLESTKGLKLIVDCAWTTEIFIFEVCSWAWRQSVDMARAGGGGAGGKGRC